MKAQIRSLLESHLMDLGRFNTAWEGVHNRPKLPYQAVWLNIADSFTSSISDRPLSQETGFLQVTLYYETGKGVRYIEQRASDIREHFYGQSLTEENVQVVIHSPPTIGGIFLSENMLALPITINFTAYQLA